MPQEPGQPPQILGVLGERACMARTLNYGALAREQMSGIERMERQIQDNLRKVEIRVGVPMNGFSQAAERASVPNPAHQIYKLDPMTEAYGARQDQGRPTGVPGLKAPMRRPFHGANKHDNRVNYAT